jgi:hypothetical protein
LRGLPARLLVCGPGILPLAGSVPAQPTKHLPAILDLKAVARLIDKGQRCPAELPLPQIPTQGGGSLARDRLTGEGRAVQFRRKQTETDEPVKELREKARLPKDGAPR